MIVSNTSSTQKSTTITNSNTENLITEIIPEVYADSLSASVADAVPVDNKSSSKILPIILFGILIIGASAGVILLRRKNKNEEITADDIAIMDS
jgi:LPXTG-motif cell wall-anchored protein